MASKFWPKMKLLLPRVGLEVLSPLSERDNGRNMFLELLVELEMVLLPVLLLLLLLLLAFSVVLVGVLVSLAGVAALAP